MTKISKKAAKSLIKHRGKDFNDLINRWFKPKDRLHYYLVEQPDDNGIMRTVVRADNHKRQSGDWTWKNIAVI